MIKKIVQISLWVIFIAGVFITMSFTGTERDELSCRKVEVFIDWSDGNHFITRADILDQMRRRGYSFVGQSMKEINLSEVEKLLYTIPELKEAQVYKTIDGIVTIEVKQRKPIFRVWNQNGTGFYVDQDGKNMPLSHRYSARILPVTGNVNLPFSEESDLGKMTENNLKNELLKLIRFIHNSEFWSAQIVEVHVNEKEEFELVPRVGDHRIMLGTVENMNEKFQNLKLFYEQGLYKDDWNKYDTITLKYKNQVICSKK